VIAGLSVVGTGCGGPREFHVTSHHPHTIPFGSSRTTLISSYTDVHFSKAFLNNRHLALTSCRTSERTGAAPTGLAAAGAVFLQTTLRTILRTILRTTLRATLRPALPGFLFQMLIRPRRRSQTLVTAENARPSEMRWVASGDAKYRTERSDGFVCVHYEQDGLTLPYRRQYVAR
jgi:hypothetical protein